MSRDIAFNLYAAIAADTGSFKYSNTTPKALAIAADLAVRGGIAPFAVSDLLFNSNPPEKIRMLTRVLSTLELALDGRVAMIHFQREFLSRLNLKDIETEDIIAIARSIDGVQVLLFLQGDRRRLFPHLHPLPRRFFRPPGRPGVQRRRPSPGGRLLFQRRPGRRQKGDPAAGLGPAPMIHGLIAVNKEKGISSHALVARIRRLFDTKKAGHFGTLDPNATGLLLIALGQATRFFDFYVKQDKLYSGLIRFGYATSTYDSEGKPREAKQEVDLGKIDLEALLAGFRGEQMQLPPAFSAKKFKGKPLYSYARRQQEVPINAVAVSIHELTGAGGRPRDPGIQGPDVVRDLHPLSGPRPRPKGRSRGIPAGIEKGKHRLCSAWNRRRRWTRSKPWRKPATPCRR